MKVKLQRPGASAMLIGIPRAFAEAPMSARDAVDRVCGSDSSVSVTNSIDIESGLFLSHASSAAASWSPEYGLCSGRGRSAKSSTMTCPWVALHLSSSQAESRPPLAMIMTLASASSAAKARDAQSEMSKMANRLAFGKEEAEAGFGVGDSTRGLGMIGQETGKIRATGIDKRTQARLSKKTQAILGNTGGAAAKAQAEGFHVGGERFVVINLADRSLYGRQV